MIKKAEFVAVCRYCVLLGFVLLTIFYSPAKISSLVQLPESPKQITHPQDLETLLIRHDIDPENIDIFALSGKITAVNLPENLSAHPARKRVSLFIGFLLPHIDASNNYILQQRKKLIRYILDHQAGTPISRERHAWLKRLARRYHGENLTPEQLLTRVDIIPASLSLAQAITESGWGTSRFAREGNALYGQHLASNSSGKFITSLYGNVKVAAFDSIFEATQSYMHNLNTSRAYSHLRRLRQQQRMKREIPQGAVLAQGLLHYSELGETYIGDIHYLMRRYKLDRFDVLERGKEITSAMAVIFPRKKIDESNDSG